MANAANVTVSRSTHLQRRVAVEGSVHRKWVRTLRHLLEVGALKALPAARRVHRKYAVMCSTQFLHLSKALPVYYIALETKAMLSQRPTD